MSSASTERDPVAPTSGTASTSVTGPAGDPTPPTGSVRTARIIATVAGLLGMLLFVLTPILPVKQTQATLDWPQGGDLGSVTAPLISYTPTSLDATIPCSAVRQFDGRDGLILGTMPVDGEDASARGMFLRAVGDRITLVVRDVPALTVDRAAAASGQCQNIVIHAGGDGFWAEAPGAAPRQSTTDANQRPLVTGVYTDLPKNALIDGLHFTAQIDSRFSSSPSVLKLVAMVMGGVLLVVALGALHRLDLTDGRRARRFLPRGWFRPRPVDAVVLGVLGVWHFIGGNTSDDGYLLTMARVADGAGYMANYYRWFGVPESPFGSPYYDLLAAMAQVSTASPWMRLPALAAAVVCWLLISREIIPRLGRGVRTTPVTYWTSGMVFLTFWLPYNNGLRPEPFVAVFSLLTWASVERAIATGRMLPYAVAVFTATLALSGNPTGLMAVAALLIGLRPMLRHLVRRRRQIGVAPVVATLLAAGTAILLGVFRDQTLAAVLESTRVRSALGPNNSWYEEFVRYYYLFLPTVDGGLPRRFPVMVMFLCIAVVIVVMLRRRQIAGASRGPAWRLVGVVFGTMFFMAFSPTKWVHHFGVYAGIAGAIAALAALAVWNTALRSARNRSLFLAAILLLLAVATSGQNGWWYVSSYGIPWWDKSPSLNGYEVSTVFLVLGLLACAIAAYQHLRQDYARVHTPDTVAGRRRIRLVGAAPLAVFAALMVLFEVASFGKGMASRADEYTVGKGNLRALTGDTCMMAEDVLLEEDPNAGLLQPYRPPGVEWDERLGPLAGDPKITHGFTPDGLPHDIAADPYVTEIGTANSTASISNTWTVGKGQNSGTDGGIGPKGVNGSVAKLPFGLDPARTPVLGSYSAGDQVPAFLETSWYELGQRGANKPLVTFSVAGHTAYTDLDGVFRWGQEIKLEAGKRLPDGTVQRMGYYEPYDVGPQPSWRNLRVPVDLLPADADVVRIMVNDPNVAKDQWVAVTPPRMSALRSVQDVLGSTDPVLLDWAVAFQFPCQRPYGHDNGVIELPRWRILPDHGSAVINSKRWQAYDFGGPLGLTDSAAEAVTVPSYQKNDWKRDWGSLERLKPRGTRQGDPRPAEIGTSVETRWGTWKPGAPIRNGFATS